MKPADAAARMKETDDDTIVLILSKMEDSQAARVLSQLEPARAARLTEDILRGQN